MFVRYVWFVISEFMCCHNVLAQPADDGELAALYIQYKGVPRLRFEGVKCCVELTNNDSNLSLLVADCRK